MKRYIALVLALVMLLLAACGTARPPVDGTTPTTEVTSPSGTETVPDTSTDGLTDATGETTEPSTGDTTAESTTDPTTEPTDPTGDSSSTGGTEETTQPADPTDGTQPPEDYTLKVASPTMTLEVGKSITLKATYTGNKSLSWSSNNSAIASVSNGKVTAHKAGDVVITVSDGTKNAQCVIHIDTPLLLWKPS